MHESHAVHMDTHEQHCRWDTCSCHYRPAANATQMPLSVPELHLVSRRLSLFRRTLAGETSAPRSHSRFTSSATTPGQGRTSIAMPSTVVSTPRQSASVIVVNPQNEVLLVQRNPKSQSFAGAHVRYSSSTLFTGASVSRFFQEGITTRDRMPRLR